MTNSWPESSANDPAEKSERLSITQPDLLSNTFWQIGARWLQFLLSAGINIWVARHLGPAHFGQLAYAVAIATLLQLISKAGAEMHIKAGIIKGGETAKMVISSGLWLRVFGCVIIYVLLLLYTLIWVERNQGILLLMAGSLIFTSISDIFQCYYSSVFRAKSVALSAIGGTLISLLLRVVAIVYELPLWVFGLANASELLFAGLLIGGKFVLEMPLKLELAPSWLWIKNTLIKSFPLYVSALTIAIYHRVDHLMIQWLVGDESLGWYAAASRLAERLHLIPAALGATFLPIIIKQRTQRSAADYMTNMQRYFDLNVFISIGLIAGYFILGQFLVRWALGAKYEPSVGILSILILTLPSMALGVSLGQYIVAEGWYKFAMFSNCGGAVLNVAFNCLFIPKYGAIGAAWATFVSYVLMHIVFTLLYRPTRDWGRRQVWSILLPLRLRTFWCLTGELLRLLRGRLIGGN